VKKQSEPFMAQLETYLNITFIFGLGQLLNVYLLMPINDHAAKVYFKDKCIGYGMQLSKLDKLPNGLYDFKCK